MGFSDVKTKGCSCGTLIKKHSCSGRVIRLEDLDVGTAERINSRVYVSAWQNEIERNSGLNVASALYTP